MSPGARRFESRPSEAERYPSTRAPRLDAELECFLEVRGASSSDAEEVATAVAEELEGWLAATTLDADDASTGSELARELRLLGYVVSIEADVEDMMSRLELLMGQAGELMQAPVASRVRRKLTPRTVSVALADLYGPDDQGEETVVKKAVVTRSANRILEKDGSEPPPTLR